MSEALPQVICRELPDVFSVSSHSRVARDSGWAMQLRELLEYSSHVAQVLLLAHFRRRGMRWVQRLDPLYEYVRDGRQGYNFIDSSINVEEPVASSHPRAAIPPFGDSMTFMALERAIAIFGAISFGPAPAGPRRSRGYVRYGLSQNQPSNIRTY